MTVCHFSSFSVLSKVGFQHIAGVVVAPTRPDWPRGLNQLGNTCYLNSLLQVSVRACCHVGVSSIKWVFLQYFYTIKDLREAIAPLALVTDKVIDDDKLKEDDLKNHRVGGRMVTRREVVRSRKCECILLVVYMFCLFLLSIVVSQLANLFYQLEHSDMPAVTPTIELAKLALVTSKDEEEDDLERGGTDSSHSTDATLVDESTQPAMASPSTPPNASTPPLVTATPSTILGKRPRALLKKRHDHFVAEPESVVLDEDGEKDFVLVSKVGSSSESVVGGSTPQSSSDVTITLASAETTVTSPERDQDGDVRMVDAGEAGRSTGTTSGGNAPPLPPRPQTQATTSGSDMMFGK